MKIYQSQLELSYSTDLSVCMCVCASVLGTICPIS